MSDDLPAAAIAAAHEALSPLVVLPFGTVTAAACAVLVAATERIECPYLNRVHAAGWDLCPLCAGTGFLYVLKQSESE